MKLAAFIFLALWHPAIAEEFQIRCQEGWCIIKVEALQMIVDQARRATELERLCGWRTDK